MSEKADIFSERMMDGGRITLPMEVQKQLNVQKGDRISFILDEDSVRIVKTKDYINSFFAEND